MGRITPKLKSFLFPGAYILDVNNDDKKDLIVTPNSPTLLEDRRNVWFFENVSRDESFQFEYRNKSLFVGDMIDMGTVSHPAFGDVNGDGLFDLVVGNFGYYSKPPESPQVSYYNSRLYLYLNTGTPVPLRFAWKTIIGSILLNTRPPIMILRPLLAILTATAIRICWSAV